MTALTTQQLLEQLEAHENATVDDLTMPAEIPQLGLANEIPADAISEDETDDSSDDSSDDSEYEDNDGGDETTKKATTEVPAKRQDKKKNAVEASISYVSSDDEDDTPVTPPIKKDAIKLQVPNWDRGDDKKAGFEDHNANSYEKWFAYACNHLRNYILHLNGEPVKIKDSANFSVGIAPDVTYSTCEDLSGNEELFMPCPDVALAKTFQLPYIKTANEQVITVIAKAQFDESVDSKFGNYSPEYVGIRRFTIGRSVRIAFFALLRKPEVKKSAMIFVVCRRDGGYFNKNFFNYLQQFFINRPDVPKMPPASKSKKKAPKKDDNQLASSTRGGVRPVYNDKANFELQLARRPLPSSSKEETRRIHAEMGLEPVSDDEEEAKSVVKRKPTAAPSSDHSHAMLKEALVLYQQGQQEQLRMIHTTHMQQLEAMQESNMMIVKEAVTATAAGIQSVIAPLVGGILDKLKELSQPSSSSPAITDRLREQDASLTALHNTIEQDRKDTDKMLKALSRKMDDLSSAPPAKKTKMSNRELINLST